MAAVRRLERAVRDYGFNHAWIMPSMVGLPPDHKVYYPIYAKCAELGVAIKINVGMPGPVTRAVNQRSICLDEVCIAFPELTVVAAHVGHPWHLEVVAMLQKHANFYLITSGFAPKHVPQEIWDVANKRVPHKIMFSSDYPILPMSRCVNEAWDVPLKDDVKRRWLRENAIELFKLG
jgi:predicted TIM-barrel fold metal-dependent hydrolase